MLAVLCFVFRLPRRALISDNAHFVGHYPPHNMVTYKGNKYLIKDRIQKVFGLCDRNFFFRCAGTLSSQSESCIHVDRVKCGNTMIVS